MGTTKRHGVTKPLLGASFAAILVLLTVLEAVDYVEARDSQQRVGDIVTSALRSVELVGELGMDIDRERLLTGRHVFVNSKAEMAQAEHDLDAVHADFAASAAAYAPLMVFPGEPVAWYQLARDNALKDSLVPAVIALSRENRDDEARKRIVAMEPLFEAIQADIAKLIRINNTGADTARARMREVESSAQRFRLVLTLCISLVLASIGVLVIRVLGRNEDQLRQNALDLERKNRELDAFAGRVAHDLRGPLGSIGLASSILVEPGIDQKRPLEILQRGVTQMSHIVDELLDLSRIGVSSGATGHVELVAASVAEDLAPMVRDAGGTLSVDLQPAAVRCSDGLLRQLLWNLGENAVKYRRPDVAPAITVTGRAAEEKYQLAVSDNGLGMTADDAAHMFDPFFRAKRTSSIQGTGLGLAIVRRVIDACGGTVEVASEPGCGTRIEIALPLANA